VLFVGLLAFCILFDSVVDDMGCFLGLSVGFLGFGSFGGSFFSSLLKLRDSSFCMLDC